MSHKTTPKAAIIFISSLVLASGLSATTANAQPGDADIANVAAQLGLFKTPSPKQEIYQDPNQGSNINATVQPSQQYSTDPYAIKRLQIHRQNEARRKARAIQIQRIIQHRNNARINARNTALRLAQQSSYRHSASNNNIWGRINQGYRLKNYNYQPLVKRFINKFSSSPQKIQRLAERSSDYLFLVVTELNNRRMPTELAFLPFVESAYRNTAYSHAGAAGMWQFIPETGRRYGLKQTRSYDARLDPHQATKAALTYLQKLNREFRGDWLLTLAAYNAGERRVHREISKNINQGRPTDYWNLDLPRETKQYVPRLLAYKEILSRPRAYGLNIKGIPNSPALARIQVNKPVNLRKAAAYAGIPARKLLALNSGFLHGITTPRFSNSIILPRSHANVLNQIIHDLPPAADVHNKYAYRKSSRRRSKSRRRYIRYKVRHGDSLYRIARKHGTTVKRIKRLNKIHGNRIKPGISLIIAKKHSRRKRYS